MTSKQQPVNGWTKRIMDALPLVILGLTGWICLSVIQLKISVAEMHKDIGVLLAAKGVGEASTVQENTRRLKELEETDSARGGVPIVAAPVTVVNPPDKPVPVETAPKK